MRTPHGPLPSGAGERTLRGPGPRSQGDANLDADTRSPIAPPFTWLIQNGDQA